MSPGWQFNKRQIVVKFSHEETAKQLEIEERNFIGFLLNKKYIYRSKCGKLLFWMSTFSSVVLAEICCNNLSFTISSTESSGT